MGIDCASETNGLQGLTDIARCFSVSRQMTNVFQDASSKLASKFPEQTVQQAKPLETHCPQGPATALQQKWVEQTQCGSGPRWPGTPGTYTSRCIWINTQ